MSVSFHPSCGPCLRRENPSHCELDNLLLLASLRTCRVDNKRRASFSPIVIRLLIQHYTADHFKNKILLILLTFDASSACLKIFFYQSNRHSLSLKILAALYEAAAASIIGQVNSYSCILGWFSSSLEWRISEPPHKDDKSHAIDYLVRPKKCGSPWNVSVALYYSVCYMREFPAVRIT